MLQRLAVLISKFSIPDELIVNWDQTGVHFYPTTGRGRAVVGSKQVAMVGGEDKRQITVVLGCSAAGGMCKPQLVFKVRMC